MELSTLQGQLKVAIQNHQIIVAKMKTDPQQNAILQKKLQELQAEIMVLSEKQKQVVQQLRKELENKQNSSKTAGPVVGGVSVQSGFVTPLGTRVLVTTQQSISVCTGVQSQGLSLRIEKPSKIPPVPAAAQQLIQQVAIPNLVSNLVAQQNNNHSKSNGHRSNKASILFKVSPTSPPARKPNIISNENSRRAPLLVVPQAPVSSSSNSTVSATITSHSSVLNLTSPIRVPQYPPPLQARLNNACVTSTVNTCSTVSSIKEEPSETLPTATPIVTPPPASSRKEKKNSSTAASNTLGTVKVKTEHHHRHFAKLVSPKKEKEEPPQKMSFMTALGLVNRDVLNELQSKRFERKRRTTANPQFSVAALEEKRRNAAAALLNASHRPFKKPRGGARKPKQAPPTPIAPPTTVQSCSSPPPPPTPLEPSPKPSLPASPPRSPPPPAIIQPTNLVIPKPPVSMVTATTTIVTPSTEQVPIKTETKTTSPNKNLLNGCLKSMLQRNGGILTEVVLCGICHLRLGAGGGDMLACMGCKRPYHTRCAAKAVPNSSNNNAPWTCPKCTMTIGTTQQPIPNAHKATTVLTVPPTWKKEETNSIDTAIKQSKEEEKRKLLKRSRELSAERSQLQDKLHRLADAAAGHFQKQVELISSERVTQDAIKQIENTVTIVQNS